MAMRQWLTELIEVLVIAILLIFGFILIVAGLISLNGY
jgi:hypothetical protein